jgi:uncharacterized protein (DUF1330 family)
MKTVAVYLVIEYFTIKDEKKYLHYTKLAEPIVRKYGGEYLARTSKVKSFSNDSKPERVVIIRFPSERTLEKCFNSEEYKKIVSLREESTVSRAVIIYGLEGGEQ